jgi:hypothetical protein
MEIEAKEEEEEDEGEAEEEDQWEHLEEFVIMLHKQLHTEIRGYSVSNFNNHSHPSSSKLELQEQTTLLIMKMMESGSMICSKRKKKSLKKSPSNVEQSEPSRQEPKLLSLTSSTPLVKRTYGKFLKPWVL